MTFSGRTAVRYKAPEVVSVLYERQRLEFGKVIQRGVEGKNGRLCTFSLRKIPGPLEGLGRIRRCVKPSPKVRKRAALAPIECSTTGLRLLDFFEDLRNCWRRRSMIERQILIRPRLDGAIDTFRHLRTQYPRCETVIEMLARAATQC